MKSLVLVAMGGALGSVCRFLLSSTLERTFRAPVPIGTLVVNVLGSGVMGFVAATVERRGLSAQTFLTAGILGGFTTYSAFNAQLLGLMGSREGGWALAYLALTVLGCLGAGLIGVLSARAVV
jgi:fluoride exporter